MIMASALAARLNQLDDGALEVRLVEREFCANLVGKSAAGGFNLCQCCISVDVGLANAQII